MATRAPNPETVEVLLDTTWRMSESEAARTDALDSKAATVATFASLITALTATLGVRLIRELDTWWAFVIFIGSLMSLLLAVGLAIATLWPREYLTLGVDYIRRFPTWGEILKAPAQVRGETMRTLVEAIVRERSVSDEKLRCLRWSFKMLGIGLALVALEGATLAFVEVYS